MCGLLDDLELVSIYNMLIVLVYVWSTWWSRASEYLQHANRSGVYVVYLMI